MGSLHQNSVAKTRRDLQAMLVDAIANDSHRSGDMPDHTYEIRNVMYAPDKPIALQSLSAPEPGLFDVPLNLYASSELLWYMSCDRNVSSIPFHTPPIWKRVTESNGGIANSQYGYVVFGRETDDTYSPFVSAVLRLLENANSRRSIINYVDSDLHKDLDAKHFRDDKGVGTYNDPTDFLCTMYSAHRLIKVGYEKIYRLHYTVHQRSCDAILGFKNDYTWHRMLMLQMHFILAQHYAMTADVQFTWIFDSLHVYHRDLELVDTADYT